MQLSRNRKLETRALREWRLDEPSYLISSFPCIYISVQILLNIIAKSIGNGLYMLIPDNVMFWSLSIFEPSICFAAWFGFAFCKASKRNLWQTGESSSQRTLSVLYSLPYFSKITRKFPRWWCPAIRTLHGRQGCCLYEGRQLLSARSKCAAWSKYDAIGGGFYFLGIGWGEDYTLTAFLLLPEGSRSIRLSDGLYSYRSSGTLRMAN